MTITKKQLKALKPCKEGWEWYLAHPITDLRELMTALVSEGHTEWAWWLATRLMTKAQCVEYAVYAAELVLPIWEARYPADHRPHEAIRAARAWLADPCESNRKAAAAAAAAYATYAYATYAAAAAFASASSAAANPAAYSAAYAAAHAAYVAANAVNAFGSCIVQLIDKAIRILEAR